jgi:hypothetical protein
VLWFRTDGKEQYEGEWNNDAKAGRGLMVRPNVTRRRCFASSAPSPAATLRARTVAHPPS